MKQRVDFAQEFQKVGRRVAFGSNGRRQSSIIRAPPGIPKDGLSDETAVPLLKGGAVRAKSRSLVARPWPKAVGSSLVFHRFIFLPDGSRFKIARDHVNSVKLATWRVAIISRFIPVSEKLSLPC